MNMMIKLKYIVTDLCDFVVSLLIFGITIIFIFSPKSFQGREDEMTKNLRGENIHIFIGLPP